MFTPTSNHAAINAKWWICWGMQIWMSYVYVFDGPLMAAWICSERYMGYCKHAKRWRISNSCARFETKRLQSQYMELWILSHFQGRPSLLEYIIASKFFCTCCLCSRLHESRVWHWIQGNFTCRDLGFYTIEFCFDGDSLRESSSLILKSLF